MMYQNYVKLNQEVANKMEEVMKAAGEDYRLKITCSDGYGSLDIYCSIWDRAVKIDDVYNELRFEIEIDRGRDMTPDQAREYIKEIEATIELCEVMNSLVVDLFIPMTKKEIKSLEDKWRNERKKVEAERLAKLEAEKQAKLEEKRAKDKARRLAKKGIIETVEPTISFIDGELVHEIKRVRKENYYYDKIYLVKISEEKDILYRFDTRKDWENPDLEGYKTPNNYHVLIYELRLDGKRKKNINPIDEQWLLYEEGRKEKIEIFFNELIEKEEAK